MMRRAALVVLLGAQVVWGQGINQESSAAGSGSADFSTDHIVAKTLLTTEAGGLGGLPLADLGPCVGQPHLAWKAPFSEPFICDGAAWHRVWTAGDGRVARPDEYLPTYGVLFQAADGEVGPQCINNCLWRLGRGTDTKMWTDGTTIFMGAPLNLGAASMTAGSYSAPPGMPVEINSPIGAAHLVPTAAPPAPIPGYLFVLASTGRFHACDGVACPPAAQVLRGAMALSAPRSVPSGASNCSPLAFSVPGVGQDVICLKVTGPVLPTGLRFDKENCSSPSTGLIHLPICNTASVPVSAPAGTYSLVGIQ